MITYWQVPIALWLPLAVLFAMALHLVVGRLLRRHTGHYLVAFLAGAIVGALAVASIVPRGTVS